MTSDKYGLYDIIRGFYEEFKDYLKKVGIEIKGIRLRVLESSNLLPELSNMIKTYDINKLKQELNTVDKSLLEQISNDDNVYIINKKILENFI
jgi:archaellum component FlaC